MLFQAFWSFFKFKWHVRVQAQACFLKNKVKALCVFFCQCICKHGKQSEPPHKYRSAPTIPNFSTYRLTSITQKLVNLQVEAAFSLSFLGKVLYVLLLDLWNIIKTTKENLNQGPQWRYLRLMNVTLAERLCSSKGQSSLWHTHTLLEKSSMGVHLHLTCEPSYIL